VCVCVCVCVVCVCLWCVCVVCVCVWCVCALCVVQSETLARLKCNLPGDGRRPKRVGAVLIQYLM